MSTENPNSSAGPSKPPIVEETIFEGSPGWIGRTGAFALSWLGAFLLVLIPVLIKTLTTVAVPWWVIALGVVGAIIVVVGQATYHRTLRYRITNYRIDYERGVMVHRIDSLELWHLHDVSFRQTLAQRLMGVATITVLSDDETTPKLDLLAIPSGREVFERLKTSVLNAKRQRGILELDR